jgi:branched-chain amino acid transport system permease protein
LIEEIILFGAVQGAYLSLLAMGFSLVYGVGGVLNLAHGAFYLLATYIFFWLFRYIPVYGTIIGIILALIITTLIAGLIYLGMVKPLRETHIGVVLITFGTAYFMEQFVKVVPWSDSVFHTIPFLTQGTLYFFGVAFPSHYALIIIASIVCILLLALFIKYSKLGKSIRAVSQDIEAAQLVGINADRILMITFMISAFLAALAAILYVPADYVAPHLGWSVLLNSFAVVVLGGMGSLIGSIVGAYIIGFATAITNTLIDPALSSLIPIVIIIIMLIIRPRGIFGKKEIRY